MAITVEERWETGTKEAAERPRGELQYIIRGTDDLDAALTAFRADPIVPTSWGGIFLTSQRINSRLAEQIWAGVAQYGQRSGSQIATGGEGDFAFEIGTESIRLTHSLQTVASYAPGDKDPPTCDRGINWDGEAYQGIDKLSPTYTFSETHYLAAGLVSPAYKAQLFRLVGTVNGGPFKGFSRGEVLFIGASGALQLNEERWQIRYQFHSRPNLTGLTVGPITGITKEGWQLVWVLNEKVESERRIVGGVRAVYVEQVYDYGNFAQLGIG